MMGGFASGCSVVATAAPVRRPREGGDHARLRSAARQRIPSSRRYAPRPSTPFASSPTRRLHADAGVTLLLRERGSGPTTAQSLAWLQSLPDPSSRHLDLAQLTARHGFDAADRDRVVRWATAAGLQVTGEDAATRRLMVRGRVEQLAHAFEVDLERFGWTAARRPHRGVPRTSGTGASSGASRRGRRGGLRPR